MRLRLCFAHFLSRNVMKKLRKSSHTAWVLLTAFLIAQTNCVAGYAQDSVQLGTAAINSPKNAVYEFHTDIFNSVTGKALADTSVIPVQEASLEELYMVQTSPYDEMQNRIHYLQDAYGFSESQAMLELGVKDELEVNANVPVELFEFRYAGPDGINETGDDKPLKSLMRMRNGDLSSRFYLQDGSTVLVQTVKTTGITNGILKNAESVPVRGYLFKPDGSSFFYHYDQEGAIVID